MLVSDDARGVEVIHAVWMERKTYGVVVPGTPYRSDAVSIVVGGTAEGYWPVRLIERVDSMEYSSLSWRRHDEAQRRWPMGEGYGGLSVEYGRPTILMLEKAVIYGCDVHSGLNFNNS